MQISVVVVVDTETALNEGSLENNAFMVHNTDNLIPGDENATGFTQRVVGTHNPDGSQATESVLNWLIIGVAGLPTTLPKVYYHRFSPAQRAARLAEKLRSLRSATTVSKLFGEDDTIHVLPEMQRRGADGRLHRVEGAVLDSRGEPITKFDRYGAGFLQPQIVDVYGPAVDAGVMFPALYGSPDMYTMGWYWSASVDTARVGRHQYFMDVVLHDPVSEGGKTIWMPHTFALSGWIDVTSDVMVNGFTGTIGPVPLPMGDGGALPAEEGDVL